MSVGTSHGKTPTTTTLAAEYAIAIRFAHSAQPP